MASNNTQVSPANGEAAAQTGRTFILGIDSATIAVGWGIVEIGESVGRGRQRYVDCGVIRAKRSMDLPERLAYIAGALIDVIGRYKPEEAAVEMAFVSSKLAEGNQRTAIALGEGRGMVLCTLYAEGIRKIVDYAPRSVKAVVTGSGASTKEDVRFLLRRTLVDGSLIPDDVALDATDALALAVAHAIVSRSVVARIKPRGRSRRPRKLSDVLAVSKGSRKVVEVVAPS